MPDTDHEHDIFISYSHEDKGHTNSLAASLQDHGIRVWWDEDLASGAVSWRDEIASKLMKSRYLLVLLSSNSARSLEVQREAQFMEQYGGGAERIITVRVGKVETEDARPGLLLHLASSQHVWNEDDMIGPEIVKEVVACIRGQEPDNRTNMIEDQGISYFQELPPESIADHSFELEDDEHVLIHAVHDVARIWMQQRRIKKLAEAVDKMRPMGLMPNSNTESFAKFCRWVKVAHWYSREVSRRRIDWADLPESLDRLASQFDEQVTGRELLADCPEVHQRLADALKKDLASRLAATHDGFIELSSSNASMERQSFFKWFEMHGHSSTLSAPVIEDLSSKLGILRIGKRIVENGPGAEDLKRGLWDLYRVKAAEESDRGENAAFPPPGGETREKLLERIEESRKSYRVAQYVKRLSDTLIDGDSDAETNRLLQNLRERMALVPAPPSVQMDSATCSKALQCWENALETLLTGVCGEEEPEVPEEVEQLMREASTVFPTAGEHLSVTQRLKTRWDSLDHLDVPESKRQWQVAVRGYSEVQEALMGLLEDVARPYAEMLETAGASGETIRAAAIQIEKMIARLEGAMKYASLCRKLGELAVPTSLPQIEESWPVAAESIHSLVEACQELRELLSGADVPINLDGAPSKRVDSMSWMARSDERLTAIDDFVARIEHIVGALPLPFTGKTLTLDALPAVARTRRSVQDLQRADKLLSDAVSALTGNDFLGLADCLREASGAVETFSEIVELAETAAQLREKKAWVVCAENGDVEMVEEEIEEFLDRLESIQKALQPGLDVVQAERVEHAVQGWRDEKLRMKVAAALNLGDLDCAQSVLPAEWEEEDAVTRWGRAVRALADLRGHLSGEFSVQLAVELNADTGMPPPVQALDEEERRLEQMDRLVQSGQEELAGACHSSDVRCEFAPLKRVEQRLAECRDRLGSFRQYRAAIDECHAQITENQWSQARDTIRTFIDQTSISKEIETCAFQVLGALDRGKEIKRRCASKDDEAALLKYLRHQSEYLSHPLLARFRALRDRLSQRIESPAGRRFGMLCAALNTLERKPQTEAEPEEAESAPDEESPPEGKGQKPQTKPPELVEWLAYPVFDDEEALRSNEFLTDIREHDDDFSPEEMGEIVEEALARAGNDRPALHALMGDPEPLIEIWAPWDSLHNIAVAAYVQLRESPASASEAGLAVLIGHCALLACDPNYRKRTQSALDLDQDLADATSRQQLAADLAELFGEQAWGDVPTPGSWCAAWHIECCAIQTIRREFDDLEEPPHPVGPSLGRALGQQRFLSSLFADNPEVRAWYGPAAQPKALQWQRQTDEGLRLVEQSAPDEWPNDYSFPQDDLLHDMRTVEFDLRIQRLRAFHFPKERPDGETDLAQTLAAQCGDCLALLNRLDLPEEGARRIWLVLLKRFRELERDMESPQERLGRDSEMPDAVLRKECMDRTLEVYDRFRAEADLSEEVINELEDGWFSLNKLRSDFCYEYGKIGRREWYEQLDTVSDDEAQTRLEELIQFANEARTQSPASPYAALMVCELEIIYFLKYRDPSAAERALQCLGDMDRRAIPMGWPKTICAKIQEYRKTIRRCQALPDQARAFGRFSRNRLKGIMHAGNK